MTSKYAVIGFTKQLAYDFGKQGVKANLLAPGYMDTPMTRDVNEPWLLTKELENLKRLQS